MKVLLVADARSVHTRRWAVSLKGAGVDIVLYSLYDSPDDFFSENGIRLYTFSLFTYKKARGAGRVSGMLMNHYNAVVDLKSVISSEHPDVLHAHYATSFGLVAALSGFHPFVLSVWGSDVYEFPYLSRINAVALKFILRKADRILSTSEVMAVQTSRFTSKDIGVIPFGVDTELFRPCYTGNDSTFLIGNVKTLSPKYGIDVLIEAFKKVKDRNPGRNIELMIVGDGPCRHEYEELAERLGVRKDITFAGFVPNSGLPSYYNSFSVDVSLSRSESFGVVAVEAMSCGCPVVVSDADGFKEVVKDSITGYIVPRDNPQAAADAIQKFLDNPQLREKIGNEGRKRVTELYDWNKCVSRMVKVYRNVGRS